ncbi:MAG: HipA domain-containing protein [Burkholderiaceae bacterium]
MTSRTLIASINGQQVGTLHDQAGLWAFEYCPQWLGWDYRFPLSPQLPLQAAPIIDGGSIRPVQWYFDNLLPEEGQRRLLAADARIDGADAFALLAWYGAESAGSLTLLPADSSTLEQGEQRRALPDQALSQRIRALPHIALTHNAPKRMSLAGAQHKLAVEFDGEQIYEPIGQRASSHILKPDHPDPDYPHSVVNEWFVMELARALGLSVPIVHRNYVPEPVYLIERFDRVPQNGQWLRRHVVDACQLLGLDRSFKYAQGNMDTLSRLARACRSPAVARTRLFNWLVFNVLTGNSDAHLKNLSFMVSNAGVQLAPHYDLLSIAIYDSPAFDKTAWPNLTSLAWPILGASRFVEINRAVLIEAAQVLGIQRATAERLLASQLSRISDAATTLYLGFETDAAVRVQANPDLGAALAGESRALRAIIYGVIREMLIRLR